MKFKINELYYVKFLDHCIGQEELISETVGWVQSESKNSVILIYWRTNSTCKETNEANNERLTIIKSTIVKKRIIKIK